MRAVLAAGLILAMANAASPALDLVYIAEAAGENDMGIVASGLVAQREINTLSAEAKAILPSGCTPSLKIKIYDHGVDVNKAAKIAINNPTADGIIGPDYSSISVVASPVSSVFNIPVCSYWATSPKLNDDMYSNFHRTIPDDLAAGLAVLKYLQGHDIKNANVGYSNDPYGIGFAEALLKDSEQFGVKMTSYSLGTNLADASALGKIIEKSSVNVWVLIFSGSDIKSFVSPMLKELTRDVHFIFSETMSNTVLCSETKKDLCVTQSEQQKLAGSIIIKAQGFNEDNAKGNALIKTMKDNGITQAEAIAADPTNVFKYCRDAATCSAAGPNIKFPTLHDIAAFSYDAVYAYAVAVCMAERPACCKSANGCPSGTAAEKAEKKKCMLLQASGLEFDGATGKVRFDATKGHTRDPTTSYLTLTLATTQTGEALKTRAPIWYELDNKFVNGKWGTLKKIYAGSTSADKFEPLKPIEVEEVRVSTEMEVIVMVIAGMIIAASIIFFFWSAANAKVPVVKRAQPEFLYMMCVGCIISSSVPIIMTIRSQQACRAAWIVYAVGFGITVGSLSAKTIRIYRIFKNKRLRKVTLTVRNSLPPMMAIIIIEVSIALAMVYSGAADYTTKVLQTDEFGRDAQIEYRCQAKGGAATAFFLWNIALLASLSILCYLSRSIDQAFSESKYISMSCASSLQFIGIGFLLISISESNPSTQYLMVSLMTLVTDGGTLALIFIPKVIAHITGEQAGKHGMTTMGTSGTSATSVVPSGTAVTPSKTPSQ